MTPAAFTKLGIRLLALHIGLFAALPGLLHAAAGFALSARSLGYALLPIILTVAAIWLWMAADRILDAVLPPKVPREIGLNYPRLQGLALTFVGGLLVFYGLRWLIGAPTYSLGIIPHGVIYAFLGLMLFCAPVWRRRH